MKLRWANLNKEGSVGLQVEDDIIIFLSSQPVIIQPSEIQRVKIDIHLEIEPGYILNISTWPRLYEQAGEIFPALITVDHTHQGELMIPVRNNGRNPLNLLPSTPIAQAYAVRTEKLTLEEFIPEEPGPAKLTKTRPQKKNPNYEFEVR